MMIVVIIQCKNAERFVIFQFQNSDLEDKSLSQADSLDDMSDIICGENFNTLKKGPNLLELSPSKHTLAIEPPPEFQDRPNIVISDFPTWLNRYYSFLFRFYTHYLYSVYILCIFKL